MNRRAMTNRFTKFAAALTLPVALLLSACGSAGPTEEPPLAGARIGGPFTLTDSAGKQVNWSDFDGKYRIVYLGYAYCPDVCPMDVQRIMRGYEAFQQEEPEMAAQVQPIFITIDPERDTPEVLAEFIGHFPKGLVALTGTPEQIAQVVKDYGAVAKKGEVQANGGYLMDHTNITYLMGRKGEPLAMLPTDQGPEAVAADLAKWTD